MAQSPLADLLTARTVAPFLERGQLLRVTQDSWLAEWSYFLVAPAAHFKRPAVRAFIDWALEEARIPQARV